jgi:hypothetical protein
MHGNELSDLQYTCYGQFLHSIDIYLLYKCIMTFTGSDWTKVCQSLEVLHQLTYACFCFN